MYSNQQGFGQQGQQFVQGQQQQFQPAGYVQSHYQGQLSQPTFNHTSQSITGGYTNQFQNQPSQYAGVGTGYVQAHTTPSPVTSHFQSGNGPVISHIGYQAGNQIGQNVNQQYQNYNQNQYAHVQSQYQNQNQHLTQHTGQYYEPVISRLGYEAGQNTRTPVLNATTNYGQQASYSQQTPAYSNYANANQVGGVHAATPINPVYQATNATQNVGPVISKLGYSSVANQF